MTWTVIGTYATAICLLIGSAFVMVGTIGLVKLKDSMTRLHAPTKVGTVGVGAVLAASIIHNFTFGYGSYHEVLIMAFLFVTAPVSANFIAKVNIHERECDTPPKPTVDEHWATLKPNGIEKMPDQPAQPSNGG
ncbi:monovalent cation/H(+) antiporter subunit G [Shimia ponticola]|uniref:monovalent cation/H(+) antiporter subunit G n=1 Tax=Shimia ponticola TaxID=2582893 RepID=UPI0011BE688E|nr:monovalent cation/H(+) antiporter subunit G [Shimia ponticola]